MVPLHCSACGVPAPLPPEPRSCGHDDAGVVASLSATAVRGEATVAGETRRSRIRDFVAWLRSVAR